MGVAQFAVPTMCSMKCPTGTATPTICSMKCPIGTFWLGRPCSPAALPVAATVTRRTSSNVSPRQASVSMSSRWSANLHYRQVVVRARNLRTNAQFILAKVFKACKVYYTNKVVSTVPFGMCLDKSDVEGVIHYSVQESLEEYIQETGCAGSDGRLSHCHLLFYPKTFYKIHSFAHR
ncbi:uncharacterized protein LOC133887049 [Phragmites australis]|uniref:uncharacterized protein LOC133887049 n=1 Tax=Phragmites australis TaxID=29695 RepID=UPI002D776EAD|nr:uncharacterized protein LOC133887049 [Phragmites australis]XP_062182939.1 uncharacterized protein LOC133887049 [Phragmites australis]